MSSRRRDLFGNLAPPTGATMSRSESPYDSGAMPSLRTQQYTQQALEGQLESQVGAMGERLSVLKGLGERLGEEINKSNVLSADLVESMEGMGERLKLTYTRMMVMAKRSGVGWKAWLGFFAVVVLFWWYVWLT